MCRVPTNYLDASLGIKPRDKHFNDATLHEIATHSKQSDTEIVHTVQKAILNYRQHKPPARSEFTPTPKSKKTLARPAPTPTPTSAKTPVRLEFTPTPKSKKISVRPTPTPTPKSKKQTGRTA
jgi:hypothetical protein